MIIKCGDTVYSSEDIPLLVVFTEEERQQFVDSDDLEFCACPDHMGLDEIFYFRGCEDDS